MKSNKRKQPQIISVNVNDIVVDGDFRNLNAAAVDELAESIQTVGLLHFPTVYIEKSKPRLIAGQHRLAAVKKLGWSSIPVSVVTNDNSKKNRMQQITENTTRLVLDKIAMGEQVKEWIELSGGKGRHSAQPYDKGFSKAARAFKTSNRKVGRLMKAAGLNLWAKAALKKHGLANTWSVIEEVSKEKPGDQVAKVVEIVKRRKASKKTDSSSDRAPRKLPKERSPSVSPAAETEQGNSLFENLKRAWAEAGEVDRRRFIDEVVHVYQEQASSAEDDWTDAD